MKPVVRLLGDDADVRAVGCVAVEALHCDPGASDLFAAVSDLHRRRRQQIAARASSARAARTVAAGESATATTSGAWRAAWATLVTLGLLAALVLVVEFGPADRKNAFSDPQLSATIALIAGVAAAVLLVVVALVPVPMGAAVRSGR